MSCPPTNCSCGDRLIHQSSKGAHESSSALGQYVHDELPQTFYYADIDGAIYKRATGVLRIVEHKNPGQTLRKSQMTLLPLLSVAVQGLVQADLVHPESGVFAMWAERPFETAAVTRVNPGSPQSEWTSPNNAVTVPQSLLRAFLTGELLAATTEENK